MMVLVALLACTDAVVPTPDDSAPLTSWSYDEEREPPLYDAAQIEAQAADRLPQLLGIDPYPLYDAYNLAMSAQDRDCPSTYEIAGVIGWGAECSSASGWSYWGRSQGLYVQHAAVEGVQYETYGTLLTNARMTSPDGEQLYIVGYSDLTETLDGSRRVIYSYLLGEFSWDGPGSEGTWLTDSLAVSLIVDSSWEPSGARSLRIDGGVASVGKDNPTLNALDLVMTSAEAGASCTAEPTGALQLVTRDPQTYDITFDGTACDGCGEVSYHGEDLGPACFDFSEMLDWEGRPW